MCGIKLQLIKQNTDTCICNMYVYQHKDLRQWKWD